MLNTLIPPLPPVLRYPKAIAPVFFSRHLGSIVVSYLPSSLNEITLTALHTCLFFKGSAPNRGCTSRLQSAFCLNFNVIPMAIHQIKQRKWSNGYICDKTQAMEMLLLDCRALSAWTVVMTILVMTVGEKRMEDFNISGKD